MPGASSLEGGLVFRHSCMLCRMQAGGTAERHDVGYGVATQTVRAVDAARAFSHGVQAIDGFARSVERLRIDIDPYLSLIHI